MGQAQSKKEISRARKVSEEEARRILEEYLKLARTREEI